MSKFENSLTSLNNEYDICVIGELQTGKTSLILQYVHHKFVEELDSAVEELYVKVFRKGTSYNEISILDTSSNQDNYTSTRKKQLFNTSVVLFVYDITDRNSFLAVEENLERIKNITGELPPFALAGLKSDLEFERQISYEEAKLLAYSLGALNFAEASAKENSGIDDIFKPLVTRIIDYKSLKSNQLKNEMGSLKSVKDDRTSPKLNLISPPNDALTLDESIQSVSKDQLPDLQMNQNRQSSPLKNYLKNTSNDNLNNSTDENLNESIIDPPPNDLPSNKSLQSRKVSKNSLKTESHHNESTKEKSGCCVIS